MALTTGSRSLLSAFQVFTISVTAGELSEADTQSYALVVTGMGTALAENIMGPQEDTEQPAVPSVAVSRVLAADNPWAGWSGPPTITLDHLLHPCYVPCVQAAAAEEVDGDGVGGGVEGGDVCRQFTRALSLCRSNVSQTEAGACPQAAVVEATELCLGHGCDFAGCGVSDADVDHSKKYKVQARIVLRGASRAARLARCDALRSLRASDYFLVLTDSPLLPLSYSGIVVDAFNKTGVSTELIEAVATWLRVDTSSIRLLHVNGYKLDPVDGRPTRQLFTSHLHPRHGVEIGLTVYSSGRQASNTLKSSMASTYGHLTPVLHQSTLRELRAALVFDVESTIMSYKLLPGGVAYELGEEVIEPPPSAGWLKNDVLTAGMLLVPVLALAFLYWRTASIAQARPPLRIHRRKSWPGSGDLDLLLNSNDLRVQRSRTYSSPGAPENLL